MLGLPRSLRRRALCGALLTTSLAACSGGNFLLDAPDDTDSGMSPSTAEDGGASGGGNNDDGSGNSGNGNNGNGNGGGIDAGNGGSEDAGSGGIDAGGTGSTADAAVDAGPTIHPLAGNYAVRTVLYARQKSEVADSPLDIISEGTLLSIANVSDEGVVTEHYCFIETTNLEGIFSWTRPLSTENIPDSVVQLAADGSDYVRSLEGDRSYVSWSPTAQPANCVKGETHSSGCLCGDPDGLPVSPEDCRVSDLDNDTVPGGKLYVDVAKPEDPQTASGLVGLNIVGVKAVEWRIPAGQAGASIQGKIEGGIEQSELSREGDAELLKLFGRIRNSICPGEYGHVELVPGEFTCQEILAGRANDSEGYGVFNTGLDQNLSTENDLEKCPDPDACKPGVEKDECGVCGGDGSTCGPCFTDTDTDGTVDCQDGCPNDAAKTAVGACGCGVADTNSDGDAVADCLDACPNDANKTAAGACGCGVADTDGDGDGTANCVDGCAADAAKTQPGICGCGVADTNTDGDSQADCIEQCDSDPSKLVPGACGCGVADTNTDGDSQADCNETCDSDPAKTAPGICGCGTADTNTDGDSQVDCNETCDSDPAKTAPGACGCGVADTNTDGDSQLDCNETCDSDPAKTAPGICGCGLSDADRTGDGVVNNADCTDSCPNDPNKFVPGICGCGVADTNTDGDSQADCNETCDSDPAKTAPGACGCGVADTNTDGDGQADCNETCDSDPAKTAPGACGCGVADTNTDGDSQADCNEACDTDPNKLTAGVCGCGNPDTDSDGDGVANCNDACPDDPAKTTFGLCGCGVPEGTCSSGNPLVGTYVVRSVQYGRQDGSDASKAIGYSVVTVVETNGQLVMTDNSCWAYTQPINNGGWYTWQTATSAQNLNNPTTGVPVVRTLQSQANGTYLRPVVETPVGFNPALCTGSCSCPNGLPAFGRGNPNTAANGCSLVDHDQDTYKGIGAWGRTQAPGSLNATNGLALVHVASLVKNHWTITPAANRFHTATLGDDGTRQMIVGCTASALVCSQLRARASNPCSEASSNVQFIPVRSNYTCADLTAGAGAYAAMFTNPGTSDFDPDTAGTQSFNTSLDRSIPSTAECPHPAAP